MPLMMMERYKRKTRIITFMLLVILGVVGQVEDVCAAPWHYGGWLLMIYFYGRQTAEYSVLVTKVMVGVF